MSSFVSQFRFESLFLFGNHSRRTDRSRINRGCRLRLELLEDRITPATPTVTGLNPSFGPAAGGTLVTITGTGFTGVTAVDFGTNPATSETVISPTSISAQSPAGSGIVNVTVTATGGTSPITSADEFTYGPTVTGLSPSSGPAAGGTVVSIIGTGFTGATAVHFGTAPGTNLTVTNDTSLSVTSPAGSGVVNVTVTTPAGTSPITSSDEFTYPLVPTVTGLSPSSGPAAGGTFVTITGTSFTGATAVDFGPNPATNVTVVSNTSITATSPAGAGVVDVTVTAPGGTSATSPADQFTYGPTVTGLSPRSGPVTGGTLVTVTGTSLGGAIVVDFGTTPVTSFISASDNQIVLVSPASFAGGPVNVTVTTPIGTSAITPSDVFTYTVIGPAPTVSGISPTAGPPTGGTLVTITGTGFAPFATSVFFGLAAATNINVLSSTSLTADSPPGSGIVNVTVTTPTGSSTTTPADQFSYAPTVTNVSPRSGLISGGTGVTITGVNLGGATAVFFGTVRATLISNTSTQIVAISPVSSVFGPVNVIVSTSGGNSAATPNDEFFYSAFGAVQPLVSSISPNIGSPSGGTVVTITGSGFDPGSPTSVFFGPSAASSITVLSTTTIAALSPAGAIGAVNVTVTTYGGTSPNSPGSVFTYSNNGPQVTSVQRYGIHSQPTYLLINFNGPLAPAPAQMAANYQIVGGGQRIKVVRAIYDAANNSVTLVLAKRLLLQTSYRLTVNGTPPSGLTNPEGVFLDGAGTGQPGTNFVTTITSKNLAGSASQLPTRGLLRAAPVRPKASRPAVKAPVSKTAVDHLLATQALSVPKRRARV
jgi:hypothetical protein